ncbi:tumor necrosis factor receptor superfamily member 4-like [Myotis lucifugus]|uniref:tumor necrosis factor receptor superfamily member 4-like n=1 Tax=Myotis lucifugus TaxID=59463 RepID=UPI000CCC25DF|nr:tumor necrosis factor receptor superfamily member 4-like [Myotis lucifugus]
MLQGSGGTWDQSRSPKPLAYRVRDVEPLHEHRRHQVRQGAADLGTAGLREGLWALAGPAAPPVPPGSGSETKRACTTTNDTLCSCRPGTQPHGGFKRGVDCAPCPPRHFSRGNNEACKPWTNCTAEGKHTLQAASSSSDAVCEDRTLPATQPGQTRGPSARPSTTQPSTRWTLTSQPPTSPPTEPPRGPELTAVLGLALGLGLLAPVAAALVLLLNCTVWRPPAAPKPPGGHGFRKPIQEEQSDAHSTLAKL